MKRVCILQPCYKVMPVKSYQSMVNLLYHGLHSNTVMQFAIADNIKIDYVRNYLVDLYLKKGKGQFDYILWIDSDSVFEPQHFDHLLFTMEQNPEIDIVGARVNKRASMPTEICAWHEVDGKYVNVTDEEDGVVEVDAIGFGFIMMKPKVIEDMYEKYGERQFEFVYEPKDIEYTSEDVVWSIRAKNAGYKIYIDMGCHIGHVGGIV